MGTKNNPGKYDCYEKAAPDEPMFVLLARDDCAPYLVMEWIKLKIQKGEHPDKLKEALNCAYDMLEYKIKRKLG